MPNGIFCSLRAMESALVHRFCTLNAYRSRHITVIFSMVHLGIALAKRCDSCLPRKLLRISGRLPLPRFPTSVGKSKVEFPIGICGVSFVRNNAGILGNR